MSYHINENKGDLEYHVEDKSLVIKIKPEVLQDIGGGGSGGGSGSDIYIVREYDPTDPTDKNVFSSLRTLKEIQAKANEMEGRYVRKDIDDTVAGNLTFQQSIHSPGFSIENQGWQINQNGESWFDTTFIRDSIYSDSAANSFEHENGFKIWADGDAWLRNMYVKKDAMFQGNLSSPYFVSGFPAGKGWALTWRDVMNAAGATTKKAHFETDDITVRGILRVYEMVISQLLGENGTHLTTDMMKIKSVDTENKIIYLDTEDGILYNPFWTDDILMVQRFNGMPTAENGYYVTRQYEFVVEETHIGSTDSEGNRVDWIKYKNFVGEESNITERDTLVRVDNLTNSDRKGIIKQTSVEPGSPYMDIIYGMKTDPDNAVRSRYGRLEGLITPYWGQLEGYGVMCDNAYLKGKFMLHNGDDVFQKFEIIDGRLESEITAIRNEISSAEGNILRNSSFTNDTYYWVTNDNISIINVGGKLLWFNSNFYSDKRSATDIYRDGNRNVLRVLNSKIYQPETNYIFKDGTEECSYSFSLFYKVKRAGTLKVGIPGTDLYEELELSETTSYERLYKLAEWDKTGNFEISFTGEILIYGVSLYNDAMAGTIAKMQTQIFQNEEQIALRARLDYVDAETNAIRQHYDSEISVMADEIALRATKEYVDAETDRVTNEWQSELSIKADQIEASVKSWTNSQLTNYSTITQTSNQINAVVYRVNNIENTISTAGWITTSDGNSLYARKDNVISTINQSPESISINASKINLNGTVSFSSLNSSLQSTINGKVDTSSLGSLAYEDLVENAMESEGLIDGGYMKMSLIDVDNLYVTSLAAVRGTIGAYTVDDNRLYSTYMNMTDDGISFSEGSVYAAFGKSSGPGTLGVPVPVWVRNNGELYSGQSYGVYVEASGGSYDANHALYIGKGFISGFAVKPKRVATGLTSVTLTHADSFVTCYNQAGLSVYLPASPQPGKMIFIRKMNNYDVTVYGNGNNIHRNQNSIVTSMALSYDGDLSTFFYDGLYWCAGKIVRD